MSTESLLQLIRSLECELQDAAVRRSVDRLNELLHAEFREFGSSGRCYDRQDMLRALPLADDELRIKSEGFALQPLGADYVLLTYRSARIDAADVSERHVLRSSIWKFESARWQIIFHQGTPADSA